MIFKRPGEVFLDPKGPDGDEALQRVRQVAEDWTTG